MRYVRVYRYVYICVRRPYNGGHNALPLHNWFVTPLVPRIVHIYETAHAFFHPNIVTAPSPNSFLPGSICKSDTGFSAMTLSNENRRLTNTTELAPCSLQLHPCRCAPSFRCTHLGPVFTRMRHHPPGSSRAASSTPRMLARCGALLFIASDRTAAHFVGARTSRRSRIPSLWFSAWGEFTSKGCMEGIQG